MPQKGKETLIKDNRLKQDDIELAFSISRPELL